MGQSARGVLRIGVGNGDDSPATRRDVVVYLMSDMLQSNHELYLERTRLTQGDIHQQLERIESAHGWSQGNPSRVEVRVLVPGLAPGEHTVNSPQILKMFWQGLFSDLNYTNSLFQASGPASERS